MSDSDWSEIDDLLRAVVADGFTVYLCGDPRQPEAIVATYAWEDHVDFVVIKDEDDVTAARARRTEDWDVFSTETVVWSYHGHAQWALRAILDLVPPDYPSAPDVDYPAPDAIRIADQYRIPMSVRMPRPGLASRRANRLRMVVGL